MGNLLLDDISVRDQEGTWCLLHIEKRAMGKAAGKRKMVAPAPPAPPVVAPDFSKMMKTMSKDPDARSKLMALAL